jgi:hypothetical protein
VLVQGVWDRVRSRLVPLEAGGDGPDEGFFRTASATMFGVFYLDYAVEVENQKGAGRQSLVSVL